MNKTKNDTRYWDEINGKIISQVGKWQGGLDVDCQGYSLMNELMGKVSLMQLTVLNATGKLISKNVADWIEINFMGLSYPDSRIWCNQIGAYIADTHATVVAAASAAILSADSRVYGGSQTTKSCMAFLKHAQDRHQQGDSVKTILANLERKNGKPMIVGFARPIDRDDERLLPYREWQKTLKIPEGKYLKFALLLSEFLKQHHNLSINSGGYSSAVLLDQGFTPDDGYKIKAHAVVSGAIACYRNGELRAPNSFLPQKCKDVKYVGVAPRKLP